MVCGNMEIEASRSYIDNLYDNHEDKVVVLLYLIYLFKTFYYPRSVLLL